MVTNWRPLQQKPGHVSPRQRLGRPKGAALTVIAGAQESSEPGREAQESSSTDW